MAGSLNEVAMSFSNPIRIDLLVDSMNLIIESHLDKTKFSVEMHIAGNDQKRDFIVPSLAKNCNINLAFDLRTLGKFRIIGKFQFIKLII